MAVSSSSSASACASTSAAIRSGWLCSSGGSGCTSAAHPRRDTIAAIDWASAPHAMIVARDSSAAAREGQLLDETVVEVSTVGELDIVHLLQQRPGAGPLLHRE